MGLLDSIEKLINEHGSAAILKERIELANDKYDALERKSNDLENENRRLSDENSRLSERLRTLEQQVGRQQSQAPAIEPIQEQILQLLCEAEMITAEDVAHALKTNLQVAEYHLKELETRRLVRGAYSTIDATEWSIVHGGRAHLIGLGLLK